MDDWIGGSGGARQSFWSLVSEVEDFIRHAVLPPEGGGGFKGYRLCRRPLSITQYEISWVERGGQLPYHVEEASQR